MTQQQYDMRVLKALDQIARSNTDISNSVNKLLNKDEENDKAELAIAIVDIVDTWLDELDITIPCEEDEEEERKSTENAARIYGVRCGDLIDRIFSVL